MRTGRWAIGSIARAPVRMSHAVVSYRCIDRCIAPAPERIEITAPQPRLNDLLRGKIEKFSLDALFDLTLRKAA